MKFTIDNKFTTIEKKPIVKQALNEFKAMFTANDVLTMCETTHGESFPAEVVACDVSAFNLDSWSDDVGFVVDIIARSCIEFVTVHFHMSRVNGDYAVNEDPTLLTVERFRYVRRGG